MYHQLVVEALIADGWTITDDPLRLSYGGEEAYVDLGAEQAPIGAEKGRQKIAVEIKSFVGASPIHDLEIAIGQYHLYRDILSQEEPERLLYLAVPERAYYGIFGGLLGQLVLERQQLRLIVFSEVQAGITTWIPKDRP